MTPPTHKPSKCQRCSRTTGVNGKPLAIHWSHRCAQWLCLPCHFAAPELRESTR